jgi:hypothetical protein
VSEAGRKLDSEELYIFRNSQNAYGDQIKKDSRRNCRPHGKTRITYKNLKRRDP